MDGVYLVYDSVNWQTPVNTVMNFRFAYKMRNFLTV
jgi:hypothetical protein